MPVWSFESQISKWKRRNTAPQCRQSNLLSVSSSNKLKNWHFFRFINPAIIAPDGFDVIDLKAGQVLSSETRKCLGLIARCLQSAAAGTSDSESSALPPYLRDCQKIIDHTSQFSKRFQIFFRAVINVPEPDARYGVNEYSEATVIQKPQVILNVKVVVKLSRLVNDF